jgi:hypothetical protein
MSAAGRSRGNEQMTGVGGLRTPGSGIGAPVRPDREGGHVIAGTGGNPVPQLKERDATPDPPV